MSKVSTHSLLSLTRRLAADREATDDASLLARYRVENDPAAFGELVRRHGPLVLGVCRRMLGHVQDADDAFQATFLVLIRSAHSIRKPNALSAWLYGAAVRVCRKALGKRGKQPRPPVRPVASHDPFADVAWKELRGLLDEELGRLPESLRAPLVLCYFEGLPRDEAAQRLGWSRRTLLRRLEEGRQRLRLRLEHYGAGTLAATAAVLSPTELTAQVSDALMSVTANVGSGGSVSAAVRVLAVGGAPSNLLNVAAVVSLVLLGGGALGLATAPAEPAPEKAPKSQPQPVREPETATRLDGDGRPLPTGTVFRLGSRKFRIEGRSHFVLPSPDGKHILVQPEPSLSAYAAQGLMLLDADTGLRVRTFEDSRRVPKPGTSSAIRPAAFSPDGSKLYALAWHKSEEENGQSFYVWANFDNPCKRVILVWDVATGKKSAEWELPPGKLRGQSSLLAVYPSPDGKTLFVSGAIHMRTEQPDGGRISGIQGLHVLDAATGKALDTWEGAGHPAAVTANGKEVLTFGEEGGVFARDIQTGKVIRKYPIAGHVDGITLSGDGALAAAVAVVQDKGKPAWEIKLWASATGQELRQLTADPKLIGGWGGRLAFSADDRTLYLGTGRGRLFRWNVADGAELPGWDAHRGRVADLFFRPGKDQLISAGDWDHSLRRWDSATGKLLSSADAYVGKVASARSPDGTSVALADLTGRVDVWDVRTGKLLRNFQLPLGGERSLLFSPDGRELLEATDNGTINVRDAATGKALREFTIEVQNKDDSGGWCALAFSLDGKHLIASKYGHGTQLFTWPDGKVVWSKGKPHVATPGPGGRVVAGNWHGPVRFLDLPSGNESAELPGPGMAAAAFSPDGRRLVTAHLPDQRRLVPNRPEGPWRVRDAATGQVLKEVKAFRYPWSVAFSPSGWLLAVSGDNGVRVYDTASWAEVARLDGHEGTVWTTFFGPNDATLISVSSEDGTALVWDLRPPAGREPPGLAQLWADLIGDGPTAARAVWAAARHPKIAVKLFRETWPVTDRPDAGRVGSLIAELDGPRFAAREAATVELMKLGRRVEDEVQKALAEAGSAEAKQRLERILERLKPSALAELPAADARELRAVWALELAGTSEARNLLADWAGAQVGARLFEESAAALKRLHPKSR